MSYQEPVEPGPRPKGGLDASHSQALRPNEVAVGDISPRSKWPGIPLRHFEESLSWLLCCVVLCWKLSHATMPTLRWGEAHDTTSHGPRTKQPWNVHSCCSSTTNSGVVVLLCARTPPTLTLSSPSITGMAHGSHPF